MKKNYPIPPICWLKMSAYMHGWLENELGCAITIKNQRVLCVQHLQGAKDILKMETVEDMMEKQPMSNVLSATRKNCYAAGLELDADVMKKEYGVTKDMMKLFVPIECPKMTLAKYGVLRPWTLHVRFSRDQANAMQDLLRREFWQAVSDFNEMYAQEQEGRKYAAREMIEAFCEQTHTPDMYVDEIRREWQRRVKREASK